MIRDRFSPLSRPAGLHNKMNDAAYLCIRALVTTIFLIAMVVVCSVGGFFNRMRGGGFFNLGALNETYWALQLSKRAIMAIPTAFLVVSTFSAM